MPVYLPLRSWHQWSRAINSAFPDPARRVFAGLLGALALSGCSEPFVTIPGGELSGQPAEPPARWAEVPDTIQLETRPSDPYSINIWSVGIGPDLYIATGADGTHWSGFIAEDGRVRVRLAQDLHALRAVPVTDAAERRRVAQAYAAKYEVDAGEGWVAGGLLFRLDRR